MRIFTEYKIDPSFYNKEYFLSDDYPGSENYKKSIYKLTPQISRIYRKIKPTKDNLKFLDAGCGRGELVYFMAKKGYGVYGIDYSKVAVEMSQKLLAKKKINGKIIRCDVRKTPFTGNYFDVIISANLIEHLDDNDATIEFLNEMYRVLKPEGKFYLHTTPNKLYIDYFTKYYQRYLNFIAFPLFNLFQKQEDRYKVTLEIRNPCNKISHVNEQTYFSLKDTLQKSLFRNYELEIVSDPLEFSFWKLPYYVLGCLYPIDKIFPFNIILGNHLYTIASK